MNQNPKHGVVLAAVVLLILLAAHFLTGCNTRSPGHHDTTVWIVGSWKACCEWATWSNAPTGTLRLECGEHGTIYAQTTALNTKIPCDDAEKD